MLELLLPTDPAAPLRVLCLGAHCDDIEIGCGGTLLQLLAARPNVEVHWVVLSSNRVREQEARASAALFLKQARRSSVVVQQFRDGHFPWLGAEIKGFFESLKADVQPDLVFTHFRDDRHQDHRLVSDLTWNTWRRHLVLEYEIPKYDGDLGTPNCFVPLDEATCVRKARTICEVFRSEANKGWMSEDTFMALMRLRGVECAAPGRYAEAFHCRKLVLATAASMHPG